MLAESEPMKEALGLIARAARGDATVLLRGETGTGKEVGARELHQLGPRRAGPFIKILCAALPDTLLESELFGYEKGAFTGAVARKPGRVELAEGGTLFLDEIGDITPALQVKLLRLIQDREFERLGSSQTLTADVRFVAATHRNLEEMIAKGEFREDLFYRLNVVPIFLPPLRARAGDIPKLAEEFCRTFGKAQNRPALAFDRAAIDLLMGQPWPGNVRQLQNLIERLAVLSDGPTLTEADVRRELGRAPSLVASASPGAQPATLDAQRRQAERDALSSALQRSGNNRTLAARILGVSRRTLYNKIEELGLS
jgi:two-component system response regulator AtoC